MTLGDLGATVIKVERPGSGDDTRGWGPPWVDGESTYYLGLNRNKQSLLLDFELEDDLVLARRLAVRADVLVENFRPRSLERFGLGYDEVRGLNPGIVYCSITGFGDASPAASELSGYDLLVQALSGLMSITGSSEPLKVGVAVVDHICALQATVGILAALHHRARTGEGQRVTVSLLGTALAALLNQASSYLNTGVVPVRLGNRHPSVVPYQPFATADGHLVIACGNDGQFAKLCAVLELGELASDTRFETNRARVANVDALEELLSARLATRPAGAWAELLSAVGVPAGPINDIAGAFALATSLGIAAVDEGPGGVRTVASPIALSATPPTTRLPPPRLGEHDASVRTWLEDF
jgi:crotonobetainyl-CoA:carnitine CoA-transferase CaiB-like acyl-CoA transferase